MGSRWALCRGSIGRQLHWRCSPQCPVAILVRQNLRPLSFFFFLDGVIYARELLCLPIVRTGSNSDAVISRHAKRSSQRHQHQASPHDSPHPSRLIQDDFVQADLEEISTEGGLKMLSYSLLRTLDGCSSCSADQMQQITDNSRHFWFPENKEQLLSNLQGLSVNESLRKLRAMPLSLADKMEIRYMRHWQLLVTCQEKLLALVIITSLPVFY